MKFKYLSLSSIISRLNLLSFYFSNVGKFKKLEFKALIIKPLRIEGKKYISIYKNSVIKNLSWLMALKIDQQEPELVIGEGCIIGDFNHIVAVRRVILGKNVLTANQVYISDNLHGYDDINTPVMHQPIRFKSEVNIGDGSWIGENVCIIGANIGRNCVIGANSVVTSDIPDYSIAVGAPAKVIKKYNLKTKVWEKCDENEVIH